MIEFYEAATHVSIASNKSMTSRGWQACCRMIKRVLRKKLFLFWYRRLIAFFLFIDRVSGMAGRSSSRIIGTQFNFIGQSSAIQLSSEGPVLERLQSYRQIACHYWYYVQTWLKTFTWLNISMLFYTLTASSLKMNRNLRELHLAENKLTPFDALQLGILLTGNSSLQHIDLRYLFSNTNCLPGI